MSHGMGNPADCRAFLGRPTSRYKITCPVAHTALKRGTVDLCTQTHNDHSRLYHSRRGATGYTILGQAYRSRPAPFYSILDTGRGRPTILRPAMQWLVRAPSTHRLYMHTCQCKSECNRRMHKMCHFGSRRSTHAHHRHFWTTKIDTCTISAMFAHKESHTHKTSASGLSLIHI